MVSLSFFFLFMMILFGIIGAMRGWAKELLVSFSVILAMFILSILERFVPPIRDSIAVEHSSSQFWLRFIVFTVLCFFGYQTPNLPRLAGSRFAREKLQDTLLGFVLGAFNGYLIIGSLWYFLAEANYKPLIPWISAPIKGEPMGDAALRLLTYMAPHWMGTGSTILFFAVAAAFLFIVVVFL
jgi:uncharacterized membrane protein required for colicin V production